MPWWPISFTAKLSPRRCDRLTLAYAELSQLAGWLHHDLTDHPGAYQRYQEALTAAHEVTDPTLIAYLHTCLAAMSRYLGRTGQALDHIYAAQGWARHSRSTLLRSVHAVDLARILAVNGDLHASEHALARSRHWMEQQRTDADPSYLYWWTPNGLERYATYCMLAWGRPDDAFAAAQRTLATSPGCERMRAETFLYMAEALIHKREIPAATDTIRAAAQITTHHSSARLPESIRQNRARLRPWAGNKHVRRLDDELHSLGVIPIV